MNRYHALFLTVCILVGLVACGGGGGNSNNTNQGLPNGGNIVAITATRANWVLGQDGDGKWKTLTPANKPWQYYLPVTNQEGRYGVATVVRGCGVPGSPKLLFQIFQSRIADDPNVKFDLPPDPAFLPMNLVVSGVLDSRIVYWANTGTTAEINYMFSVGKTSGLITAYSGSVFDLVVTDPDHGIGYPKVPNNALIVRNLAPIEHGNVHVNFDNSVELAQQTISIAGLPSNYASTGNVVFQTVHGAKFVASDQNLSTGSFTGKTIFYMAVPASVMKPGDTYQVNLKAVNGDYSLFAEKLFTGGDTTISLPTVYDPALPVVASINPFRLMFKDLNPSGCMLHTIMLGSTSDVLVRINPKWLDSRTTYTMPDFSHCIGYDALWDFQTLAADITQTATTADGDAKKHFRIIP